MRKKQRPSKVKTKKKPEGPNGTNSGSSDIRLNRLIAQAGVASRRKADELITAGRVTVNGTVTTELGTRVNSTDLVIVNGRRLERVDDIHILLNKPTDTISAVSDDRGRRTVVDLVTDAKLRKGLYPVGRLDRDTTGAILLTTDGDLAHRLMHPRWEVPKIYLVTAQKPVTEENIRQLRAGVALADGLAVADMVSHPDSKKKSVIAIQIHEGRNRQVRRMLEAINNRVLQLDRIRYAGLTLEGLRRGRWRRLLPHEIRQLRKLVRL